MLAKKLKIKILNDSENIFKFILRKTTITEKSLMIYLKALKEAYIEGIVDNYYTD